MAVKILENSVCQVDSCEVLCVSVREEVKSKAQELALRSPVSRLTSHPKA